MTIQLKKFTLDWEDSAVQGFVFLPAIEVATRPVLAAFTHGFTSHKGSILNWNVRLAEEGVVSVLFDLPGHYLGSFCEAQDFENFKTEAPKLFRRALDQAIKVIKEELPLDEHHFLNPKVVIGGHSLGAMLSLLALDDLEQSYQKLEAICVGLGLPPAGKTHLFDTPFYKSTLALRAQLVSPALHPDVVFPWIKTAKEQIKIEHKKVHFITGQDDLVVDKDGTERLMEILKTLNNEVSLERPTKLPHHQPEMAAGHIKKYFKQRGHLELH